MNQIPKQVYTALLEHFHPVTIENNTKLIYNMLACGSKNVAISHIITAIKDKYEN